MNRNERIARASTVFFECRPEAIGDLDVTREDRDSGVWMKIVAPEGVILTAVFREGDGPKPLLVKVLIHGGTRESKYWLDFVNRILPMTLGPGFGARPWFGRVGPPYYLTLERERGMELREDLLLVRPDGRGVFRVAKRAAGHANRTAVDAVQAA